MTKKNLTLDSSNLPSTIAALPSVVVVVGYYGVGKTNLCLNLALDMARAGKAVTLVDLDVVNPYFRSSDYSETLQQAGVQVIAPLFAQTALDSPSVSGTIEAAIHQARNRENGVIIIDAGGDDAGATALGRFATHVTDGPYACLFVVNAFREGSTTTDEVVRQLHAVEQAAHVQVTALVGNSHMKQFTTPDHIVQGDSFADDVAKAVSLPVWFTTVPADIIDMCVEDKGYVNSPTCGLSGHYVVQVYVRTPWE